MNVPQQTTYLAKVHTKYTNPTNPVSVTEGTNWGSFLCNSDSNAPLIN